MMRRAAALRCGEQRQPALELAPRGRREGKARVGNRRAGTTRAATDRGNPEGGGLWTARAGASPHVLALAWGGCAQARLEPLCR